MWGVWARVRISLLLFVWKSAAVIFGTPGWQTEPCWRLPPTDWKPRRLFAPDLLPRRCPRRPAWLWRNNSYMLCLNLLPVTVCKEMEDIQRLFYRQISFDYFWFVIGFCNQNVKICEWIMNETCFFLSLNKNIKNYYYPTRICDIFMLLFS